MTLVHDSPFSLPLTFKDFVPVKYAPKIRGKDSSIALQAVVEGQTRIDRLRRDFSPPSFLAVFGLSLIRIHG